MSTTAEEALSIYLRELNLRLKEMLESADDHLFDKSGKTEDSRYFSAMRSLRVNKQKLLNHFQQEVANYFRQNIGKFDNSEFQAPEESLSFKNLALVEDEDLEEQIAIDSMVSKARKTNKLALDNLRQRLDVLLTSKTVTEENNPFEPNYICSAFSAALKPIELGVEFELVVYKYFERNIIEELELIYQQVNQYFIDKGILPELKQSKIKKHRPAGHKAEVNEQQSSGAESSDSMVSGNDVMNMLGELLSASRAEASARVKQQVNTEDLVGLLSNLQSNTSQEGNALVDVRGQLSSQLPAAVSGQVSNGALGQYNDDMIDVVTMLFDFILDDENIQPEIKAVIGRLQIPILKAGLVDKSFLSNRKHPARLLLNELAHAGLSWDPKDSSSESMLTKIKSVVENISSEFTDNIDIFGKLLKDFVNFKQEYQKRSVIFERRTREAEEGKAKAEQARAKVNQMLEKICGNKQVPEVVQDLLKKVWVHVMFLERLKADPKGWKTVCKLAKMLIWSVQPIKEQERLDKLTRNVPVLIKNLKLGFSKISFSEIESSSILDRLEDLHREIIADAKESIEKENQEMIIHLKPVAPFGEVYQDESEAEEKEDVAEDIEAVNIEEIAFAPEQTGQIADQELEQVEVSQDSLQIVENLSAGSWMELKLDDEFKRCKLAARIVSAGKYIFVNRSGVKVAEYLTKGLALVHQQGELKLLDDEALFDRALESVISNLRSMKAQA